MAAIGAVAGGAFQFMQAQYQSKVAKVNAQIAEENAKRATERGGIEAYNSDIQTSALLGEQEVAQAASGVTLSGKSQIYTRDTARRLGRLDALNIVQAADVERYNYQTQAMNFRAESKAAKIGGVGSLVGGFLSGASGIGSLVGGSQSTASPYKYVPQPLAKPALLPAYAPTSNPLFKPRNRGMI